MRYEQCISVDVARERAWTALAAVSAWPQWTASMRDVTPLDGDDLALGRRFRIRQPGLPPMVWRVSALEAGESFTWEARSPGVHTSGYHHLTTNPDGTTRITIGIDQNGPLARLLDVWIGAKTRRYLALEAAGLQAAAQTA